MAVTPAQVLKFISQEGTKLIEDADTDGVIAQWITLYTNTVTNINSKISGTDLDLLVLLACAGEVKRYFGFSGVEYDTKYKDQLAAIQMKYNQKQTVDTTNTKTFLLGQLPDWLRK